MQKRDFLAGSAVAASLTLLPQRLLAADEAPKAGKDFRPVSPAQRTNSPEGKIEVIEFFWVACPHCRRLEPTINAWADKLPDDVNFRRVHVNFRIPSHQQLYYTLVSMKQDHALLDKAFEAIHDKNNRLSSADEVFDWAQSQGLDREEFIAAYKSFGVKTLMRQASAEVAAYGVDGVPALAVNGKYLTSPSMTGSNESALAVVDKLVAMERKGS